MAKKKTTNTRSVSTSSIVRPKIISEQVSSSLGLSNSPSKSVSVDSSTLPTIDTSDRLLKVLVENDFKYDSDKLLKPIYLFKLDGKPEFNLIEFLRSIYSKKWPNAVIKSRDPPLKLITLTYLKLEKLKFSIEWIEKIMTEADPLSFSNCLDWALIFMDPSLLPTSLTDKYLHEDSVFDVKLIPRVFSINQGSFSGIGTF